MRPRFTRRACGTSPSTTRLAQDRAPWLCAPSSLKVCLFGRENLVTLLSADCLELFSAHLDERPSADTSPNSRGIWRRRRPLVRALSAGRLPRVSAAPRRIVTGHDADGKSVVLSDGP